MTRLCGASFQLYDYTYSTTTVLAMAKTMAMAIRETATGINVLVYVEALVSQLLPRDNEDEPSQGEANILGT